MEIAVVKTDAQKSKDIDISNRIASFVKPYLLIDEQVSSFVVKRALEQSLEIKSESIKYSTQSLIYFSCFDIANGVELAEKSIDLDPNDSVSWNHYMLGMFWRLGPQEALDVVRRARRHIVSWEMMRNGLFYAIQTADYSALKDLYFELKKAEKLDELVDARRDKRERRALDRALDYTKLAEEHNKIEAIRSLSALMMEQLDWQQKQHASPRLLDVTDEDGQSLLLEIYVLDSDSKKCSDMNIKLISQRASLGMIDWALGGLFVSSDKEDVLNACKS